MDVTLEPRATGLRARARSSAGSFADQAREGNGGRRALTVRSSIVLGRRGFLVSQFGPQSTAVRAAERCE